MNAILRSKIIPNMIVFLAFLALGGILYSNSFRASFQFDDEREITDNYAIRDISNLPLLWQKYRARFIPYWTFALNYHFGKYDVTGYHGVNLIIHAACAFFVFLLTSAILRIRRTDPLWRADASSRIAIVAGLIFLCHPLQTSSVTYIVQRIALLAALFYVMSLFFTCERG